MVKKNKLMLSMACLLLFQSLSLSASQSPLQSSWASLAKPVTAVAGIIGGLVTAYFYAKPLMHERQIKKDASTLKELKKELLELRTVKSSCGCKQMEKIHKKVHALSFVPELKKQMVGPLFDAIIDPKNKPLIALLDTTEKDMTITFNRHLKTNSHKNAWHFIHNLRCFEKAHQEAHHQLPKLDYTKHTLAITSGIGLTALSSICLLTGIRKQI